MQDSIATKINLKDNPFKVFTPEGMSAQDALDLFVPVSDFNKIGEIGHAMLNGPRGCGKSMIFRYLLPDCQCLKNESRFANLPFHAILVPIKNTAPNVTEFHRLEDQHAKLILNEHVLTCFVATRVFESLERMTDNSTGKPARQAVEFVQESLISRLRGCGWSDDGAVEVGSTVRGAFKSATTICENVYRTINQYAKRLSFPQSGYTSYSGPLCDFLGFLYPLLVDIRELSAVPSGPTYLLVDDADYLSHTQTRILNAWVATRTQHEVSMKISTQLRYKTYSTVAGPPIQTPHDYQEINVADVYTSRKSKYPQKVEDILKRRLRKAGISSEPRDFFPPDQVQEAEVKAIASRIKEEWPAIGRGFRADDDVTRYSRPGKRSICPWWEIVALASEDWSRFEGMLALAHSVRFDASRDGPDANPANAIGHQRSRSPSPVCWAYSR